MNLFSCDCGVVLNLDMLKPVSNNIIETFGGYNMNAVMYFNGAYWVKAACPVCKNDIPLRSAG